MIIGYGLKLKDSTELLLVEEEKLTNAYASTDVVHTLIKTYDKSYSGLESSDSIYILNTYDKAKAVADSTEVTPSYNAYYNSPIIDEDWIGNLEVVEISYEIK